MTRGTGPLRLLTIQHQRDVPPGQVGDWLRDCGIKLDVVRPDLGMPLPTGLDAYVGLLVLGGSMGAYDDEAAPWLPTARKLLASAVSESLPTLGICLGHQLLAVACGGRVERNPAGRKMGFAKLDLTLEAVLDPLFSVLRWPTSAPRWNQDIVVSVPPDGVVMATADHGVVHGLRVGENAWGVQVHPEATTAIVRDWAARTEASIRAEYVDDAGEAPPGSPMFRKLAEVRVAVDRVREMEPLLPHIWRPFVEAFAAEVARAAM